MEFIGLTPCLLNFFNRCKANITKKLNATFDISVKTSTSYNQLAYNV